MDEMQETEVTLSTGKLLAMFFGAAIICAIFFSFGYAVGKNSAPAASVAIMDSSSLSTVSTSGGAKPGPSRPADPNTVQLPCLGDEPNCVKQETAAAAPSATAQTRSEQPAPELTAASPTPQAGAGFIVQVAAVSKAED